AVTIKGDLGQIDAGDLTYSTPGLKLLNVRSIGRFGLATQGGAGDLTSDINGAIGALNVIRDIDDALISVNGGADGKIGSLTIGGSFIGRSSGLFAIDGDIGPVVIGGDLIGGSEADSGEISTQGKIASVSIGGSLIGGSRSNCGQIASGGDLGLV